VSTFGVQLIRVFADARAQYLDLALPTEESSAWLARLVGDQEDASSNPVALICITNSSSHVLCGELFLV